MPTLDWPDALVPQTAQMNLRKSGAQFASPFNGTLQSLEFVAERWVLSCSLAQMSARNPRGVGAFCNMLSGGVQRVRVWPFHTKGVPRGTMRGAPTLASTLTRGAMALPLLDAITGRSWIRYPEDLRNTAEAGETRPWTQFEDADAGVALLTTVLPTGRSGLASRLQTTSTAAVQRQVQQPLPFVAPGTVLVASAYIRPDDVQGIVLYGGSRTPAYPSVRYRLDTGAVISELPASGESLLNHFVEPAGGGWWRVSWAWQSGTGATAPAPIIGLCDVAGAAVSGTAGKGLWVWGVQVEQDGTWPSAYAGQPTLLAGDYLGLGGQLFEVAADVVLLNDQGSVPVTSRVRGTIAAGSPVTWNRPTVEMILPAQEAGPVRRPGAIDGVALDLVETW
jgi:hypothetical protein